MEYYFLASVQNIDCSSRNWPSVWKISILDRRIGNCSITVGPISSHDNGIVRMSSQPERWLALSCERPPNQSNGWLFSQLHWPPTNPGQKRNPYCTKTSETADLQKKTLCKQIERRGYLLATNSMETYKKGYSRNMSIIFRQKNTGPMSILPWRAPAKKQSISKQNDTNTGSTDENDKIDQTQIGKITVTLGSILTLPRCKFGHSIGAMSLVTQIRYADKRTVNIMEMYI